MIKSAENPSTGRNNYDSFEDLVDIRVFIDKVHYSFDMKPYQDYNETFWQNVWPKEKAWEKNEAAALPFSRSNSVIKMSVV